MLREFAVVRNVPAVERFLDAVDAFVGNHRARPALVVLRVVLDQPHLGRLVHHLPALDEVDAAINLRRVAVLVVGRSGRVAGEQVSIRCAGRVSEFTHRGRGLVPANCAVRRPFKAHAERRERHAAGRHERHPVVPRGAVVVPAVAPRLVRRVVHVRRAECGVVVARLAADGVRQQVGRKEVAGAFDLDERPEPAVVLVVILLDHDLAVAQLRLEVEAVGRAAGVERADERVPAGAVRVDRPNAPQNVAAGTLRFERAVHDSAIAKHNRVQRPGEVVVADLLQIGGDRVVRQIGVAVVHHEELQADRRVALRGAEAVAVAGERDPPAGQRARPHVVHAVLEVRLTRLALAVVARPVRRARVRGELLVGELHNLLGFHVDFVDVAALLGRTPLVGLLHVVKQNVVDPLTVEGDDRVGHGAVAAGDEQFLLAVRVEQHEVGPGFHRDR